MAVTGKSSVNDSLSPPPPPPFLHWRNLILASVVGVSGFSGGALTTRYMPVPVQAQTQPIVERQLDDLTIEVRALRRGQLEQNIKIDELDKKIERVQSSRTK